MSPAAQKIEVRVGNRTLTLSNLDKVLYPATGFTKGQVIDYYSRIAPVLLPHLKNRPLTMKRYPNGVDGMFFFEKNCPKHRPEWVKTVDVFSKDNDKDISYCHVDSLATLVWAANLADLELHTSMHFAKTASRPQMMVYDLDPGEPADIVQCAQVALWLRDYFERRGMQLFPKTSGSKGMQVYVPLNTATSYDAVTPFAKALAQQLELEHPELVVHNMKKDLRHGKVLVDWSQNVSAKTTICVYSLRARQQPTCSTPITWAEVQACVDAGDASLLTFVTDDVLARVEAHGDLFAPALTLKQKLPRSV